MKKIITLGLTAALVLSIGGATALAATPRGGANYTDIDGNGICDNIGSYSNFIDQDGDGICDNTGLNTEMGRGKNGGRFADNDGDGVNDNIGSGNGGYFTDDDGDGECDNIGTRQGQGRNAGQGKGRNR